MSELAKSRLLAAKLDLDCVMRPSQLIKFGSDCVEEGDELLLLQMDNATLDSLMSGKEDLTIRGMKDDLAVICTNSKTFDLKEAKTSNCMILCKELNVVTGLSSYPDNTTNESEMEIKNQHAICIKSNYLEMKQKVPDISRLREVVSAHPYKGPEIETEEAKSREDNALYGTSQLLDIIPASEEEIVNSLRELNACLIDGNWRVLDLDYVMQCITTLLVVVDAESWDRHHLNFHELLEKTNDSGELVPAHILESIFTLHGFLEKEEDGEMRCGFSDVEVCRLSAEMLLREPLSFEYSDFINVWKDMVPKLEPQEDMLLGLALVNRDVKPLTIKLFKASSLPMSAEKRFEVLFDEREKWTYKEIAPYLADVCLRGEKISSLLTRHARTSMSGNDKLYSSRKIFK